MEIIGADGLSACRSGFVLHAHPGDGQASSSLQLRRPVTNFCPPAGGALPRLQVVSCLTALADNLVVDQGHQDQDFGYYQVFLRDVNRACVLTIIVNAFLKGKINISSYFCLFVILHRTKEGLTSIYKLTGQHINSIFQHMVLLFFI